MLRRVYGWRSKSFTLGHLKREFLYTPKMEVSKALKTTDVISGSNTIRVPPSARSTGLMFNPPIVPPARKKGGGWKKGAATSQSTGGHCFQFGSVSMDDTQDCTEIGNVQPVDNPGGQIEEEKSHVQPVHVPVVLIEGEKSAVSSMAPQVLPAERSFVEETSAPESPSKASSIPALNQNRIARNSDRKKTAEPVESPGYSGLINDENFPALGMPSTGKGKKNLPQSSKLDYRKSDSIPSLNVGVKGFLGPQGSDYEGDEMIELKGGRGGNIYYDQQKKVPIDALGRTLTKILRHQALDLKIKLGKDGYAEASELLKLTMKTGAGRPMNSYSVDDIIEAVKQDNKHRFGIKYVDGVLMIRANQGHTVKTVETEELLQPILTAEEIPVCVHGTYRKFLTPIVKEGLKRMRRNHVHFASGLTPNEGVISGMRKSSDILIYLDVNKALQDGMKLHMSENGVILTEGFEGVVPPKYFKDIRTWPDNEPIMI